MEILIKDFGLYLSSEKGFSKHTLEAYERDLLCFFNFLKKAKVSKWNQVTTKHLLDYLSEKKSLYYSPASICRALIAIKVFFKFLKREGEIEQNEMIFLETPKIWIHLPDILSIKEVENLLSQPDVSTKIGARDRAILEVLYATGIRVSELCQLKIQDVDDRFIRVNGKGGKQRTIPIGSKAIQAIDHYSCFCEETHNERQQYLFVNEKGLPINRCVVWSLVKKYAKRAGLKKEIYPHIFRHSFATHLLDNGADLRVIQELLGHSSITSTDRYTQVSCTQLQKAFNAFHPRCSSD